MQWYLLKTWTGREEELVKEIRQAVPKDMYKECFVIYQERIWRKQQRSIVHVEPLFPGCVFLTYENKENTGTISRQIKPVFKQKERETKSVFEQREQETGRVKPISCKIERIPAVSRLIASGSLTILPMMREDALLLEDISGIEHIVKLSSIIKNEQDSICQISGPLKVFQGNIERVQFKKRYAMVRCRLWGEEQIIVLGIILKEDENRVFFSQNWSDKERGDLAVNHLSEHCLSENIEIPVEAMA